MNPLLSLPQPLLATAIALFGACIGSFLNVVVWRLPRQESLVLPGSHCPRCGASLAWYDNIPLLSWLHLRGRCRHCRASISVRYPLVELLTAGLFVMMLLAQPSGLGPAPMQPLRLFCGWLLAAWLIPLTLIDLDSQWLPEPLCRWGLLMGLLATTAVGLLQSPALARNLLLEHLIAAAAGLLAFEATALLAQRLLGRPALGLGDAKLAALMGAWLGPTGLALAVAVAVICGGAIGAAGLLSGRLKRHQAVPFGPFLAIGTLSVWIGGHGPWLALLGIGSRAAF
ncbi:MAG: prepilin peptidase [Synechococcaceae cyanobacterium]|nr:prepilin peptidase [Synechococcaceae cyanobacterium]